MGYIFSGYLISSVNFKNVTTLIISSDKQDVQDYFDAIQVFPKVGQMPTLSIVERISKVVDGVNHIDIKLKEISNAEITNIIDNANEYQFVFKIVGNDGIDYTKIPLNAEIDVTYFED